MTDLAGALPRPQPRHPGGGAGARRRAGRQRGRLPRLGGASSTAPRRCTSQLTAWQIVDEHQVVANITVGRESQFTEASCRLRAIAEDHTVVGEVTVPVTDGPEQQSLRVEIRTERRATSVENVGCTTPDQPRRADRARHSARLGHLPGAGATSHAAPGPRTHRTESQERCHRDPVTRARRHLADPGGLRQAPGRAGAPPRPGPRGDRRQDQRGPRRGRPQGERRLPRRPRGAGQDRGPDPPARGHAAQGPGRRDASRRRRRRARHGRDRPLRRRHDEEKFLFGAREMAGLHPELQVYSPQSPMGQAIAGKQPRRRGRLRRPRTARSSRSRSSTPSPSRAERALSASDRGERVVVGEDPVHPGLVDA